MAKDNYFSKVVVLLPFEGANDSTNFSEITGKVVTVYGNTKISTAQSKFGGSSAYFDGSDDYLRLTIPSLGTEDFTIEYWLNYASTSGQRNHLDISGWQTYCGSGGVFRLYANSSDRIVGTTNPVAGTWYHIALVRYSGSVSLYINGVREGTSWADTTNLTGTVCTISAAAPYTMNGYIDEFRVTKGLARYTSNFSVPTEAFPTVGYSILGNISAQTNLSLQASAFDTETSELCSTANVIAGSYELKNLRNDRTYLVSCRPKTGTIRKSNYSGYSIGDLALASDPAVSPFIFQVSALSNVAGTAKYWRMTNITTSGNDLEIAEIQLLVDGINANGEATITGTTPNNPPLSALFDGSTGTRAYWANVSGVYFHWEFPTVKTITQVKLGAWDTSSRHPTGFTLQYSTDNSNWTTAYVATGITYPGNGNYNTPVSIAIPNLTNTDEPVWPTVPGGTVVDKDVTWTNIGRLLKPLIQGPLIAS